MRVRELIEGWSMADALTPSGRPDHSVAPVLFEDFAREHCRPFIEALDADMDVLQHPRYSLFRGVKRSGLGEPIQIAIAERQTRGYFKTVRQDRRPLDTPSAITELVDDVLEEKFGWRPRSQGVFCYTFKYRGGAESYGLQCRVYPMGPMEFVYAPRVNDMTPQIARWIEAQGLRRIQKHGEIPPDSLEAYKFAVRSFIEDRGYTNKNLHAAMMSDGKPEVIVRCSKYLAIPDFNNE